MASISTDRKDVPYGLAKGESIVSCDFAGEIVNDAVGWYWLTNRDFVWKWAWLLIVF